MVIAHRIFSSSLLHQQVQYASCYWFYWSCRKLHKKTPKSWKTWNALDGKGNIILMGNPGSGKTTTGKLIAGALNRTVIDVDDDVLTPYWDMSVADKLQQLGDKRFFEEEGRALLDCDVEKSIISLSGSNPLHTDAMAKTSKRGVVVYLDATNDTILNRQKAMKVDRIIGMGPGSSLKDVIESRRKVYEEWYDIRVMIHLSDSKEQVAEKVLKAVNNFENDPGYVSTRGTKSEKTSSFLETVLQGLATDGGLFVKPKNRPQFSLDDLNRLVPLDMRERAVRLLEAWIHPFDICPQELRSYVERSYTEGLFESTDMAPMHHLSGNMYTQELFHGPTASFKDWALQLMPRFFTKAMTELKPDKKYLILVATSGDTGSATLDGFARHASDANVGVLVLYPTHNVSEIQKLQTTTMKGKNVKVVGVDGDFDYCQQTVKKIFRDANIKQTLGDCSLSAANSINWGRLLPQTLYHASAYLNLVRDNHIKMGDLVDICIPTGNFGNILSAFYVKEMGFPIRKLICASNSNNILTNFMKTGVYQPSAYTLKSTISPSIDIIESSNLERLLYHLSGEDPMMVSEFYQCLSETGEAKASQKVMNAIQEHFVAAFASDEDTNKAMLDMYKKTGYLMDPHTAVAQYVASHQGDANITTIVSGTAHYGKFIDNILPVIEPNEDHSALDVKQLLLRTSDLTQIPQKNKLLSAMVSKRVVHKDTLPADYDRICKKVVEFAKTL